MKIHLKGNYKTRQVWLNGKLLSPERSQKVNNHSPDGFNWGYNGSGPAQLALAIMLEIYQQPMRYQDFKSKHIAGLPQADFDIVIAGLPEIKNESDNDQTAADDYLDYLDSQY